MFRKKAALATIPLAPSSIEDANHYQILGLSEASSSEDVRKSLQAQRWPWHLLDENARELATANRAEAYRILSEPKSRAEYDRDQGYTRRSLADSIDRGSNLWGLTWAVLFGVLAILTLLGGLHSVRVIGNTFAPDFHEVIVRREQPRCSFAPCPTHYEREFRSSSSAFQWLLNSYWLWIAPPFLFALVAVWARIPINRLAAEVIASVRLNGHLDVWARALMFVPIALIPIGVILFWALTASDPVRLPSE